MLRNVKKLKLFLFCTKNRGIFIPKYLWFIIAESADLKYNLGPALCKNEDPLVIFKRACEVLNFELIDYSYQHIKIPHLLFLIGITGRRSVFDYIEKKIANCGQYHEFLLFGSNYNLNNNEGFLDIFYKCSKADRLYLEFRALCCVGDIEAIRHFCMLYVKPSLSVDYMEQGFCGACEGGILKNVDYLYSGLIYFIMKSSNKDKIHQILYRGFCVAKYHNNTEIINFLINRVDMTNKPFKPSHIDEFYALTKI